MNILKLENGLTLKLDETGLMVKEGTAKSVRLTDREAVQELFALVGQLQEKWIVQSRTRAAAGLLEMMNQQDWEGLSLILGQYGEESHRRIDLELERAKGGNN